MIADTKHKILDTAERLFGEQGYDATSLRQIIAAANVNLAAVHYHFGSKEELLDQLVFRRVGPVNEARLAALDRIDAETVGKRPAVERIVEAFLYPVSQTAVEQPAFVRLMGRIHAEGLMPGITKRHFQAVAERFLGALRRALPELPEDELLWRVHFVIGAMAHTLCGVPIFPGLSAASADFPARFRRLVAFVSAGFRAPAVPIGDKS